MEHTLLWWTGFNLFVLLLLALDLGVFHRRAHEVSLREAILWSVVWVVVALAFNLGILLGWFGGYEAAERGLRAKEFLAAYLVERALSIDNIFVFAVLFRYFAVAPQYQHRVLFLGILGALILRATMILAGIWLIERFEWVLYIFAVFLIYTGFKMIWVGDKEIDPGANPVLRFFRRVIPISEQYHGQKFLVRVDGRLIATPLLLVLLFVETTDVVFALDSIPAVLLITTDAFIAYTSNVFAILGLRALYFALVGFMKMFAYLSHGLAAVLIFVGGKMLYQEASKLIFGEPHKIPIEVSLGVIGAILALAVVVSLIFGERSTGETAHARETAHAEREG